MLRRLAIIAWAAACCLLLFGGQGAFQNTFPPGVFQSRGALDPAAGGGCAPATAFLARTSGEGSPSQAAITTFMCGMVTDGLFTNTSSGYCSTNFDVLYLFTMDTSTDALLTLCSSSFNGTANGSPVFTAARGFLGVDSSTTVYIDTSFNPTTAPSPNFTQNAAHTSAWSNTNATATATGGQIIGMSSATGTANSGVIPKYVDGSAYFRTNDATPQPGTPNAGTSLGHFLANRSGATATQGYINGASFNSSSQASAAPPNVNVTVLAPNAQTSGPTFGGGYQVSMASIGGNLAATPVTNFYGRLRTYMTARGVP